MAPDKPVEAPASVPATIRLLEVLGDHFEVFDNFHPAFDGSLTLVDRDTSSAVTIVIVESAEGED